MVMTIAPDHFSVRRFLRDCLFFLVVLFSLNSRAQINTGLQPVALTCENLTNPVGIDVPEPRLSWQSRTDKRGSLQSAYRVLAASSLKLLEQEKADLWDTGKVTASKSLYLPYKGKDLSSNKRVYWKVKVWDNHGRQSAWSAPATWSMGIMEDHQWKGQWIGLDQELGKDNIDTTFTRVAARYLRKELQLPRKIKRATAHVAGLGLFELYVNGSKISDAVLAPALAEYPKRTYYMSFDISDQVEQGANAFGVILGNGRYVGVRNKEIPIYYDESKLTHYGFPKMLAQFEIEYEDGSTQTIVSDASWRLTANGPILANNEFDGEQYDANQEMLGWSKPGFNDATWRQAEVVTPAAAKLSAQMTPPIKVTEVVSPVAMTEVKPDTFIMDMGQNMVGWIKLEVKGNKGDRVSLRFAERLNVDGTLYLDPIRTAKVNDIYVLKGGEEEEWEPRFTYHGFQYVEVTGFPGEPTLENFVGKVVHDDLKAIGEFSTSNETINQIYQNARWGIRGNYRSIPTDCPQRDERQGWLGDRATGSRGESYLFDHASFYLKWLQDIEDAQKETGSLPDVAPSYWVIYSDNVTWPAAYIIIADMLYDQFGDDRGIRQHYASMKQWMAYMKENYMTEYIISKDTYGDWGVSPEAPGLIHSQDAKRKTDAGVLSTSYYFHLLGLLEEFALHLCKDGEAQEFSELRAKVKQAYHEQFFDPEEKAYKNNTATTNVLSLYFGLVPDEYRQEVFENLVEITQEDFKGHISVGLVGVQAIMRTFTDHGRPDIAYELATNTTYPSWGYMVEQGATTIWELWNGDTADPFMNSWNHVMLLGDLLIWFYEDLAGIQPDPQFPGFERFDLHPKPMGDLSYVRASHDSPYGMIKSHWEISKGEFNWNIRVPANTTARVYVPADPESKVWKGESEAAKAADVCFLGFKDGRKVYEVGSGDYFFHTENVK